MKNGAPLKNCASLWMVLPLMVGLTGKTAHASGTDEKVIVFVGDSLAQGYGVGSEEAFPAVAGRWLRAHGQPVKIINAGVSGALSSAGASSLKWWLKSKPAVVVLELGANDGIKGTSIEAIKANLAKAIDLIKAEGAVPVLAGMKMFPNLGPEYARAFAALYPSLAREKKIALIPFLLAGVAADARFNQSDGKHPNAEGHRIIGESVGAFLDKILTDGKK